MKIVRCSPLSLQNNSASVLLCHGNFHTVIDTKRRRLFYITLRNFQLYEYVLHSLANKRAYYKLLASQRELASEISPRTPSRCFCWEKSSESTNNKSYQQSTRIYQHSKPYHYPVAISVISYCHLIDFSQVQLPTVSVASAIQLCSNE